MRKDSPAQAETLHIELLVGAAPRQIHTLALALPVGSTVADALRNAQQHASTAEILHAMPQPWLVGVWGKKVSQRHVLADGDRLEIYRGLRVDPKVARRQRFAKQGAKTAGLFAKRRAGAKAGY